MYQSIIVEEVVNFMLRMMVENVFSNEKDEGGCRLAGNDQ
jgi:hypothetical protein